MAGLQTIINACDGLSIDRRRVSGIQITRNEEPRITVTATLNPWKMTLTVPSSFRYSEARGLLEAIDTLDRYTPELVTFSNNPKLNWIFRYQGTMSASQIAGITVTSFVGNQLVLGNLPVMPSTRVLFEPNDLIQIGAANIHPFPFTSTTRITRGTGATVTITTSRPNIITGSVVGNGIIVGSTCQFYMFCPNMPTYKLVPGGWQTRGTTTINNAYIEWSDDFALYEWVATA